MHAEDNTGAQAALEMADYYIHSSRDQVALQFDKRNHELITTVKQDIGNIYRQVLFIIAFSKDLDPNAKLETLSLYNKACESLTSSYVLLRQAAYVESIALLRLSVECVCVGMHIGMDQEAFASFRASSFGMFPAKRSISFAKKHIAIIGAIWAALSKIAVHPNWHMYGAHHNSKTGYSVEMGKRETCEHQDKATLLLISTIAGLIMRAIEISMLESVNGDSQLLRIPGTDKIRNAFANALINDRFNALQVLVQEEKAEAI